MGSSVLLAALRRGACGRCPQCGKGRLFTGLDHLVVQCGVCALPLRRREGDLFAFMYVSTGLVTAVFLIFMWFVTPANLRLGQVLVTLAALGLMVGTLRVRKGVAVALDYVRELNANNFEGLTFRGDGEPGVEPPPLKRA